MGHDTSDRGDRFTTRSSVPSTPTRSPTPKAADALREQLRSGEYPPGARQPSERELIDRWGVSSRTIRVALDQLRAEGLVISYQGRGMFVREQTVPRRLSTDIATSLGWYHTLARQGLKQPARPP